MGDLAADLDALDPEKSRYRRERDTARRERDTANAVAKSVQVENALLAARLEALETIDGATVETVTWAQPKRRNARQATGLLMLSDLHLDEVVNPDEVSGMNCYSRAIALQRLKRTVAGTTVVASELLSGFKFDGLVVLLGGDLVSGSIHEELRETNDSISTIATVDWWADHLASALETLADSFGRVHVVSVVGNHGRNTRKPRAKGRVQDNFDWLLSRMLVRHFRTDTRFSWNVPDSADAYFEVYGHRHLLTHGDQARGGSGISGLLTPLSLLDHRKRKRDLAAGSSYSHMWLGHWHQYLQMGSVTVNGSLKGTDEYSFQGNFGHEPPQQAFAVLTQEHGVTLQCPVYSLDRRREGW